MKKLITILLSVLLMASLFVSCDNATKAVQDELVEVTLSTQATGRSLTVSNPLESLSDVAWTYKATKVSETQFNYGEKITETEIDLYPESGEKQKLTLSQGKWIFELFGKSKDENKTLLYHGITDEVLILRSAGVNQITVEVSPYTDATGSILFSNVTLTKASNTSFYPNYIKVCKVGSNTADYESVKGENNKYSEYTTNHTVERLSAGQYEVTVAWKETIGDNPYTTEVVESDYEVVIASETIVVTVYGGRTTEISGNISEETGSGTINGNIEIKTEATQQKTVVADTPTTFTVNVAPANSVSSGKIENTTVTFAKDDFNSGIRTELEVIVKDLTEALDSGFTVSDGKAAAGITLALSEISEEGTKTPIAVSGKNIVIETHIVKGLSGVSVVYNGQENESTDVWEGLSTANDKPANNFYESDTGKLVFSTTHFSEYYVVANEVVALNTTTNTAYAALTDAINEANEGETVSLLKNVTLTAALQLGSGVSLNLNGKTIYGDTYQVKTAKNGTTTIFGKGKIKNNNTDNNSNRAALYIPSGSTAVIDDVTLEGKYGVYVDGNLTIKKATINAIDCGIAANYSAQVNVGSATEHDITVTASNGNCISTQAEEGEPGMCVNVYGGTFTSVGTNWQICPVYWASHGTLNVYGGTFSNHTTSTQAAAIYQKNGTINIYDGEFSSRAGVKLGAEESNSTSINLNIYGGKIEGTDHAALYYKTTEDGFNCTEYNINISGGEFTGTTKSAIYASTKPGVIIPSVHVTGGTFSSDPSAYVDFGYKVEQNDGKYVVSKSAELTVDTPDQLMKFAASVNAGNDYAGKTITLNKDIDLTGKKWVPIGYSSRSNTAGPIFRGTFDGQNHTITNIICTEKNDNMPSGFFGTVEGATISNLVIGGTKQEDGSYVYDARSSFTGEKDSAAGVVAFVIGSRDTVINNCKNYATISGPAPAGIVSRLYNKNSGSNKIEDCYNYGFIDGKNLAESGKAGGIVAITQSNSNSTISNCHNNGIIETYDFNAGGIIGYINPGCSIEQCTNSNSVSNIYTQKSRSVGGIVGWVANTSDVLPVSLNYCSNSGTIISDGCAGGIAGRICNQTTVNNCTNEGSVSNYNVRTSGYAGGIIGNNDGGTINECNNTAAVSGVQYSGGVVGYWGFTSNTSGSISNCSGGQESITIINNTNNWAGRIVGCANCVYSSEPFGTISIDDLNRDNYDEGLKTIGLATFGTLKDKLIVNSGTLHGLPGLRDDSNQSVHTIIFKEGSKLNLDNKTYSFDTSEATFSTKKVNGQWTWDTSSLESNKSGSASISKTNFDRTYGEFTVNEVEFLFQVIDGYSFADNATEMTITVTETESANAEWEVTFSDNSTKYYKIEIAGLATSGAPRWPNLYIKNATGVTRKNNASLNWFGFGSSATISGYDGSYYLLRALQPNYIVIE